jgi:division protein CdvB (Snf7/Vps24/ESCRT-III family)
VARRLRHQQRELSTHRYKLQHLKKLGERGADDSDRGVKQLQNAIEEERQKIRHHKGRVKHLASRMEKLDRQSQHRGKVRKGWKSIKARLGLLIREYGEH